MKRSCKDIDITDWQTDYPYVLECVLRHKSRYDFRKLVCRTGHMDKDLLSQALLSHDSKPITQAAEDITKEAVKRIEDRNLELKPVTYRWREDNSSFKLRLIGNESAMQQVYDYIAVRSCNQIWERRLVPQQISGLTGRGAIYGIGMIQGWIDKDNKAMAWAKKHGTHYQSKCKYFVKLDIRQCYPSLRTETFLKFFKRDCANETTLWLWEYLLDSHQQLVTVIERLKDKWFETAILDLYEGFMIGALPSQWACQYLMSFLYRHLTQLHSIRRGKTVPWVTHIAVQMDDILLVSSSYKNLKKAVAEAIRFAKEELGLTIKSNWQICRLDNTPIDIVGFRLYRNGGISVRPRIFLRARRMFLRVTRRRYITFSQAKRICAFKGYFIDNGKHKVQRKKKHSDCRRISNKFGLRKLFRLAQKEVSHGYSNLYNAA